MRPVEGDAVRIRVGAEPLARAVPLQREELAVAREVHVVEQVHREPRHEFAAVEAARAAAGPGRPDRRPAGGGCRRRG